MKGTSFKPALFGAASTLGLLIFYFVILTLISGQNFAWAQFSQFWYFIVSLALGFGIQVGLYVYLKTILRAKSAAGKVIAVSGTTSGVAMVSCCAHYLANILPVLGAAGVASFVGQYQTEFFWVGLAFNLGGIMFIVKKIHRVRQV